MNQEILKMPFGDTKLDQTHTSFGFSSDEMVCYHPRMSNMLATNAVEEKAFLVLIVTCSSHTHHAIPDLSGLE